jgi:hypothetical protein
MCLMFGWDTEMVETGELTLAVSTRGGEFDFAVCGIEAGSLLLL